MSATAPVAEEAPPKLRLPEGTTPLAEAIELRVDPRTGSYSGTVDIEIELAATKSLLWAHGKDLRVSSATVTPAGAAPITAVWKERDASGVASLTLASPAPAGKAHVRLSFDAAFEKGQKGLYTTTEAGESYAFTQFEAIAARSAFPCFDEPRFKIPFTVSLVVPKGMAAISNAREKSRVADGDNERVTFGATEKLPSYLIAVAVGPFDVVAAPDALPNAVRTHPLPIRAVTAKGRGKDAAYALAHTGEILATIEAYTHVAYPYEKLDVIAVPGKGGAMENAGAVTFAEFLMLFDPAKASIRQRRAYAQVMAHELAHMWVGDLVTMKWWDDLWLNEAFATWLGNKTADAWDPKIHAELSLLQGIQNAMGTDSMVSARAIRQPIESTDDIENAFDGITYQKGGGVLTMFERWVGPEIWQKGFTAYLEKHRFGNATADDFLDAENAVSHKDVKAAFHTFLDQVGVPFVETAMTCGDKAKGPATLHLTQSRYLPVGSVGDAAKTWQIPVCVRHAQGKATGEACTLLSTREADFALPKEAGCPAWIFPNANAAGYYRFALAPADLAALRKNGLASLSIREKIAYSNSVRAGYARASTPFGDAMDAVAPLANESDPAIAGEPIGFISQSRDWLYRDPLRAKVEAYGQKLYAPSAKRLGWDPVKGEADEAGVLRSQVLGFLTDTVEDKEVRKEAKRRGLAYLGVGKDGKIHQDAVSPDLAGLAVGVVGQEADQALWDAIYALFVGSVDEAERGRLLWAIAAVRDPALLAKARALVTDPKLRDNEVLIPLWAELNRHETMDDAWAWEKKNYDAIVARLPKHHGGVALISTVSVFCDEAHAKDAEAFFKPKVQDLEGGPRALALSLETVRLCVAKRAAQEANVRSYFQKH